MHVSLMKLASHMKTLSVTKTFEAVYIAFIMSLQSPVMTLILSKCHGTIIYEDPVFNGANVPHRS